MRAKIHIKRHIFNILFITAIVFFVTYVFKDYLDNFISTEAFLAWHNILEFLSILGSYSIFIVAYYAYEGTGNVRMMVIGCSFFVMGTLDIFHALSYMGMPDFFIPNTDPNRATTFWVLSRLLGSCGILAGKLIPVQKRSSMKKRYIIGFITVFVLMIFYILTYHPQVLPPMYVHGVGITWTKKVLEYVVIAIMAAAITVSSSYYKKNYSVQESQFIQGLVFGIISEIAFVCYISVYDIYNYLGHIYKFLAYFIMFKSIYTYSVKMPYHEMKKARNELKNYSEKLNILVKERTIELERINEKLLMDLEYARDIQLSLLPERMPNHPEVSFDAGYLPAERLSGDFYNVIELDENNIALYIGDVSGHGVPAAMLTIFAYQNLKPLKENDDSVEIISPGFTLKRLFKSFNQANFKDETYLVMVCGIYNVQTKRFTYASAGINVPPLVIKRNGEIIEMDVKGFAICKLGDLYMPYYDDRYIQLEQGDKILFYTDGLIEAVNNWGSGYTYSNLLRLLEKDHNLSCSNLIEKIKTDFFNHIGKDSRLKDDVTFMVMEVN